LFRVEFVKKVCHSTGGKGSSKDDPKLDFPAQSNGKNHEEPLEAIKVLISGGIRNFDISCGQDLKDVDGL
jgi:hypothetical protein